MFYEFDISMSSLLFWPQGQLCTTALKPRFPSCIHLQGAPSALEATRSRQRLELFGIEPKTVMDSSKTGG
jgi:hypothetical protein